MPRLGPAPEPTAIKRAKGNPSRRPLNKREPQHATSAPRMPALLKGDAAKEWKRIVGFLVATGCVAQVDLAALTCYCQSWSDFCFAQRIINKDGMLITYDSGHVAQRPEVAIRNNAMKQLYHAAGEFGLSPATRTRIAAQLDADNADPEEAAALRLIG